MDLQRVEQEWVAKHSTASWENVKHSKFGQDIDNVINNQKLVSQVQKRITQLQKNRAQWKMARHFEIALSVPRRKFSAYLWVCFFLIEGQLLYRILLFSLKPQHESAIDIHISPPFWISLPSPTPSHPSRLIQSPCLSFLSHTTNYRWLSTLHSLM